MRQRQVVASVRRLAILICTPVASRRRTKGISQRPMPASRHIVCKA